MIARAISTLVLLCGTVGGVAASTQPDRQAPLFDNLGPYHHPVSTTSPLAQRYVDQGMVLTFAFNHAEAIRSFREAARLDPRCAMCAWGEALALGPNINAPMDIEAGREAYAALQRAIERAAQASEAERAYIRALAARYVADPQPDRAALDLAYADAMRELSRRYPDDVDAATLFAEALMDTRPWRYWNDDGSPGPIAAELVATLESVLARAPDHPLALHLYIHALEASPDPGRAEAAADRLVRLVPGAGHLVHMPAHIYLRIGRYHDASVVNEQAAAADESYIAQTKAQGLYPADYYPHNIHFLWQAATIEGRSAVSLGAARKLVATVPKEQIKTFRGLERFLPTPLLALAQFGRWDEILAEPEPAAEFPYHRAMWLYARGLALAETGRLDDADQALKSLESLEHHRDIESLDRATPELPAPRLVRIARHLLAGDIAERRGEADEAVRRFGLAVPIEDRLPYMEPPYWYVPVRQFLGAALLRAGRAKEAEAVYREDLRRHPRNGWSLFGLAESLRAQGATEAAAEAQRQFQEVWSRADVTLTRSRF